MFKAESKRLTAAFLAAALIATISATPMLAHNKERVCERQEHQHSKECYMLDREDPVYSCGADTQLVHNHDEATCYLSEDGVSTSCGYANFVIHKHDRNCYSRTGIFYCELPEIQGHEHDEDCYEERNALICQEEEVLGHTHTEEGCYTTQKTNLCGEDEIPAHQHDASCTEPILICQEEHEHADTCYSATLACGEEETEGHTHDDGCWAVDTVLTCEQEESAPGHIHDQTLCYLPERTLTCDKQELRIHEHDESCFTDAICICSYLEAKSHQHGDACIDDVEVMEEPICGREEHQHVEQCFKEAEPVLSQDTKVDGFDINASIPVKALPDGSVLNADPVEKGSDIYATIDATLKEAEVEYDGFAAVDIHFELAGEEVEPDGPIQVTIESDGLIPPNADPDSIEVYHLVEGGASFFGLIPATPYLEKVASSADGDAITLSGSDAGYDLTATFEVSSFSYFTIVWVEKGKTLNLHCYNSHGEKLTGTTTPINIYEFSSTGDNTNRIGNITFSTLESEIQSLLDISLPYLYAYIYSGGEKVVITTISYNDETNDGDGNQWPGWIYKDSAYKRWLKDDGTPLGTADTADVYLVFDNGYPWVIDNPINENIHVTMYDFGSLVNSTSDAVLDFFSSPSGGAKDTHAQIDGEDPTGNTLGGGTRPTMYRTLVDGYPYVDSIGTNYPDGGSLGYLFHDNEDSEYEYPVPYTFSASSGYTTDFVSRRYSMDGDGGLFFRDEETGYYTYNCSENAAFFNGERFELYNELIAPGFASGLTVSATSNKNFWYNFFPFNQPVVNANTKAKVSHPVKTDKSVYFTGYSATTDNPEVTNNWFGMKMDFRFMMPQGGKVNGQDMEFYFCGDDDVWVYIDGVLVLDIGGTHGAEDAYINFATGELSSLGTGATTLRAMYESAYAELVSRGELDSTEVTLAQYLESNGFDANSDTYTDYSLHELDFFYMERGGNISYCELQFNTPVLHSHSIEIIKGLTTIPETYDGPLGDPYYEFQVLHAEEDGTPTESLFLPEGTPYTVYDLNGNLIDDSQTIDEYGIVRLKQGQRAVIEDILENSGLYYCREIVKPGIAGQYAYVEIDGVLYTFDEDVLLGEEPFYGASSPSADIAAGSADFVFTNQVKLHELGSLTVTKSVESNCPSDYTMDYRLYVTFDGTPIAEDAVYYRDDVEASVDEEGYVTIKPGEVLKFTHLLLGTEVVIYEDVSEISDDPFTVTYTGEAVSTEVNEDGTTVAVISIADKTQRDLAIENSRTVTTMELPNTGGPGHRAYVVMGAALSVIGICVLTKKKRFLEL